MARQTLRFIIFLLIVTASIGFAHGQNRPADSSSDPIFEGRPLSSWISSIRDRDEDMDLAFEAIQSLGPRAAAAVPELARIISEPVVGIRVGIDDDELIAMKLLDFQLRADAVDSLGAIGKAAAPATVALIEWALANRVIAEKIRTEKDYNAFVDLIALDVLERMRVASVISGFRLEAAEALTTLINSNKTDERKFAVRILGGHALPIASQLLKSDACQDRKLGVSILVDMWSVVPTDHLIDLKASLDCTSTMR